MDILKFHEVTGDHRPMKVRLLELKERMLHFLDNPAIERGVDILHLCISITNDYLYCSKTLTLRYMMQIKPDERTKDRFLFDFNQFWNNELFDETAYRFHCNDFFELTTRVLFYCNFSETEIEEAYFNRIYGVQQLALF